MANKRVLMAVLILATILLIAAAAWYLTYRYHTIVVPNTADGGSIALTCQAGQSIQVVTATYTPSGGRPADVRGALQTILAALGGDTYTVSGEALGQPAGGVLTFRYRCGGGAKSGFVPIPISPCGAPRDSEYAVDMTGRDAAGTVVWDPYSTQSRVSLERYAETPEAAEKLNPYTGLGKTASVRAMGDRYRRTEALQRLSAYEIQPGQPGFMEEASDGAMSLMAAVARRSPGAAGAPACLLAGTDIDTDFYTDGPYGDMALKETLTSRRRAHPNTLTGSKTGLGSTRLDPRFEPGPRSRVPDGDASWSHGGHAGGPTSGGFGAARFLPGNTWGTKYVFGFGGLDDAGDRRQVEAIDTERSIW